MFQNFSPSYTALIQTIKSIYDSTKSGKQLFFVFGLLFLPAMLSFNIFAETLYGISNGFGAPADNQIYQINPANGTISNAVQVTLPGFTVLNSLSLAYRPTNGSLYAVIEVSNGRHLVTINPTTGVSTDVGVLSQKISSISFKADGTLIGVSGDGAVIPETLFSISTTNAALTQLFALGNGGDGETIAFHPNGLLYHSSGNETAVFESVNVDTQTVTPIGTVSEEAFAMGWSNNLRQMFLSDINSSLFTVDLSTGARTLIGNIPSPQDNRGLAFVASPTAANVSVSGRLLSANGRGISNTSVTMTNAEGVSRTVRSNSFGYFIFDNVTVGNTYVIGAKSKEYTFTPRIINVTDELTDFELVAEP
jgi:hypothetical protein